MNYLTVDGMMSGTGVRDTVNGGYLSVERLKISSNLKRKISSWQQQYEKEHYTQYKDAQKVKDLDVIGLEICLMLAGEMPDAKIEYYSAAKMKKASRHTCGLLKFF